MFQDISITEAVLGLQQDEDILFIDVRSPSEFRDATIPGAINIPIFDDRERAEIGTLYKQDSVEAAQDRGLSVVSAKLPTFIRAFQQLDANKKKVVFCWRGGMRSRTTATLLSLMNVHVCRLIGGVRAYRKWVVEELEHYELQAQAIVLHGYTGIGKTAMLEQLKDRGYPIIDMEAMAGHRGSIFGHIGLPSHNQKIFDSLLVQGLKQLKDSPYFIMEAESNRIGKAVLPEFMIKAKQEGVVITIDLPVKARVLRIVEDYQPDQYKDECIAAFHRIKKRIHTPIAIEIEILLQSDQFEKAVELLLVHYYDPMYAHAALSYASQSVHIDAETIDDAVEQIVEFLSREPSKPEKSVN